MISQPSPRHSALHIACSFMVFYVSGQSISAPGTQQTSFPLVTWKISSISESALNCNTLTVFLHRFDDFWSRWAVPSSDSPMLCRRRWTVSV
ncbi:hypothetical protein BJ138DRAFT_17904 [Hygrophoropsis aurantiaca]|uniref:Uncharacterized protein n=1 Tax=Hygrophoropsis aurantiaca TaxID=72124 RepID=A0ACB8AQV6_9AGAM|nr:hypothetical protein BJ138DRAFT_17904 [Hygrophoropsis aurantiaca]